MNKQWYCLNWIKLKGFMGKLEKMGLPKAHYFGVWRGTKIQTTTIVLFDIQHCVWGHQHLWMFVCLACSSTLVRATHVFHVKLMADICVCSRSTSNLNITHFAHIVFCPFFLEITVVSFRWHSKGIKKFFIVFFSLFFIICLILDFAEYHVTSICKMVSPLLNHLL